MRNHTTTGQHQSGTLDMRPQIGEKTFIMDSDLASKQVTTCLERIACVF